MQEVCRSRRGGYLVEGDGAADLLVVSGNGWAFLVKLERPASRRIASQAAYDLPLKAE